MVPLQRPLRFTVWLSYFVLLWTAVLAGVIAWRRPELREARLLSLMLLAYVLNLALLRTRFVVPEADLAVLFCAFALGFGSFIALVAFTALFGRPLSHVRRVLNATAYASIVLAFVFTSLALVAIVTPRFDLVPLTYGQWPSLVNILSELLVIGSGAAAIVATRGSERQRVAWAVGSMGLLIALFIVNDIVQGFVPNLAGDALYNIVNIVGAIAPVGLTYSVLSRRLLDVGFALNRAVVFSAVSIVVVAVFMTAENALGGWLVTVSHAESLAVSVAIALGIGFSIRWIHGHVDRLVDVVFFRKRHRNRQALLRFAHEAAFVTDRATLLEHAVDEVARGTDAESVAILMRDAAGTYTCVARVGPPIPDVGENDPAVLTMRASGQPVDLHRRDGVLRGEYAFPMIARGALIGALVCGPKRDAESYAPDERDALRTVAHGVGMALDTLGRERDRLEAAILALPDQFAALRAELRELREAIEHRS